MSIFSKRLSSSSSLLLDTVSLSGDKVIIEKIHGAGNQIPIWLKLKTLYGKPIAIWVQCNLIRGKPIAILLN
jgi:hypothetical protein